MHSYRHRGEGDWFCFFISRKQSANTGVVGEPLAPTSLPRSECTQDVQGLSSASAALAGNPQKPNRISPESGTSVSSKLAGDPMGPLGGLLTSSSRLCWGLALQRGTGTALWFLQMPWEIVC